MFYLLGEMIHTVALTIAILSQAYYSAITYSTPNTKMTVTNIMDGQLNGQMHV